MTVVKHEFVDAGWVGECTCGWMSSISTSNPRKSWRQHVTRGTK